MRSAFATVWSILWTVLMGSLALLSYLFGKRYGAWVTHQWGKGVLWGCGVRAEVVGREHVGKGPYVVVANHASLLDIPTTAAFVPVRFHFVSRPFFFKVPFMGWGMTAAGHISIERKSAREAAKTLDEIPSRFRKGLSVVLFPEGTRSPDGNVQKYKRGPMMTALQGEVEILPVAMAGISECLPKGKLVPVPGRIRVTFGEPIPTKGLTQRDTKALAQRIEDWTREEATMVKSAAPANG